MNKCNFFPAIETVKKAAHYEALAGIRMASILNGSLLPGNENHNASKINGNNPSCQHKSREDFLYALSSWSDRVVLEYHITTRPDLQYRNRSGIEITLIIRMCGNKKDRVKEEIIEKYLALMPILTSLIPEMEFLPVTDLDELKSRTKPFEAANCLALARQKENIELSAPIKRSSTVGFNTEKSGYIEHQQVICHQHPFIPSLDSWSTLLNTLTAQLNSYSIILRLQPAKEIGKSCSTLTDSLRACETFLAGLHENQITLKSRVSMIRDITTRQLAALRECAFHIGIFILSPGHIDTSIGNILGRAITSNGNKENTLLFQGGFECVNAPIKRVLQRTFFNDKEPFTLCEAAASFRLPSPPVVDCPGLPVKRSRTSPAYLPKVETDPTVDNSIELFQNRHQGQTVPVRMDSDSRMRHTFIIGQTGTGKSTLMENMVLQDIEADRGVAVIDPHGDMIDSILSKIPPRRSEDVIILDLLDRERPLGFNLIAWKTIEERDLIVDELYTTLHRIYDLQQTGGPIFESYFRGILKLLMGDSPDNKFCPTLLEFTICFLKKELRSWLKRRISDSTVLDHIEEMERATGDVRIEAISPYITSKFSRFIHDTTLKRIVGQSRSSFDCSAIMDTNKIFLVKLGKGRFGETVSGLLANQIVSRFKMAAMRRGNLPPEKRRDFFLYVDECHTIPPENFMELLSESRKFRLGLVLATQYTSQLGSTITARNNLLSAIVGNVGTLVLFRLGKEDADIFGKSFEPVFSSRDICNIPNFNGYAMTQTNNEPTPPFSFQVTRNNIPVNRKNADKCRTLSRLKYGTNSEIVDREIAVRRKIWES